MSKRASPPGGRSRKTRLHELEEEVAQLRELLQLTHARDLEEWDILPQNIRDQMAARAIMSEWGDITKAAMRLGFKIDKEAMGKNERLALYERLFNTPGVKALLRHHTKEIEENRDQILSRLQQIAIHGSDDAAVRAIQSVAKIAGWQKTPDTTIDNRRITLVGLLGNDRREEFSQPELKGSVDAMELLSHDPGEAIEVIDGEIVS